MSIDAKYREMIEKASLALSTFPPSVGESAQTIKNLLPLPIENFEKNIRILLQYKITSEQREVLADLNYSYMAFISECKKELSREDLGKVVNLTSAFHGFVGLFVDSKGEWK